MWSDLQKGEVSVAVACDDRVRLGLELVSAVALKSQLLREFEAWTGLMPIYSADFDRALTALCQYLESQPLLPSDLRRKMLLAQINKKFRISRVPLARLFSLAARRGVTFSYRQKEQFQRAFDLGDSSLFETTLGSCELEERVRSDLREQFSPVEAGATLCRLRAEVKEPTQLRRARGSRPVGREIVQACLASFVFSAAEPEVLHAYFDPDYDRARYESEFWKQIRTSLPGLGARDHTLEIHRYSPVEMGRSSEEARDQLLTAVARSYAALNNFGHLAVWIDPMVVEGHPIAWELAADVMVFAEKHVLSERLPPFFRWKSVARETAETVQGLNEHAACFSTANEGFTYRDTFVCVPSNEAACGDESLLLVFQKNERDETLVPCPACRSRDVQGNSYSSLGVRSWECQNLLCPDRTKYNRGKRYSFKALLTQEASGQRENRIEVASVRKWSRDVQLDVTFAEAVDMLVAHYSLYGDTVYVSGGSPVSTRVSGRRLKSLPAESPSSCASGFFQDNPWFHRYAVKGVQGDPRKVGSVNTVMDRVEIVHGDALDVLAGFDDECVDASVTSPPYYNAREYSQWHNIYSYLHEMYGVAREVFRVLRAGGFFLYNIFDSFDNEKSLVRSAMGRKRLVLSGYSADLLRRTGFAVLGNVAWDKGHIEGRRGFNGGNFSPYYQAPFNCWEHVLVCWKPDGDVEGAVSRLRRLPSVLENPPVKKIVRGRNTHGHSAPFPEAIPKLLRPLIPEGAVVLDPFAGSATTGRALAPYCSKVICIEKSREYCELATALCRGSVQDAQAWLPLEALA